MDVFKIPPVNIWIIENNRFIRSGIEMIINAGSGFKVTGSFSNFEDAIKSHKNNQAEIILIDIKLLGASVSEYLHYIKRHFPGILLIAYSSYEDDKDLLEAVSFGVVGFVSKKALPKELLSLLSILLNGGSPISPNMAKGLLKVFKKQKMKNLLTENEFKLLGKISVGKSYTTAAKELCSTEKKILIDIRHIYKIFQDVQFRQI